MRILQNVVLLLGMVVGGTALAAAHKPGLDYPSVWECNAVKPNWYCDKQPEPPPAEQAPSSAPPLESFTSASQLREELKRREDLAVMHPTEDNLKSYLEAWQLVQDKSATFADAWRRVVWQNPELDYAQRRPTNNTAVRMYDDQRRTDEEGQLRKIAQEHGLIFFFRSDCPYCHRMAPTLRMFANRYGIDVLGVSVDGGGLPDFPQPADGRSVAEAWGIDRVPALFIGSKKNGDHAPIGFGIMSVTEIVERLFVLTATEPGQTF